MEMNQVVRAEGIYMELASGQRVIDAASGVFNLHLGYASPVVRDAIQRQLGKCEFMPSDLRCDVNDQFERALAAAAPAALGGRNAGFRYRDACGSTAIEGALKMARRVHPDRARVVTFARSHHGQTYKTTSISGGAFRRLGLMDREAQVLPYDIRSEADEALLAEGLAEASRHGLLAIVVEPVQGNGGNAVASARFIRLIEQTREQTGAVLVLDEVQTGLGRTGHLWGAEAVGFTHFDIIVAAKGLSNGLPLGVQLFHPRFGGQLAAFDHSFTSGGNALSLAAASAVLQKINDPEFLAGVRDRGAHLGALLRQLRDRHRCVGSVRGLGMMYGLEIHDDNGVPSPELAAAVAASAWDCGVRVRLSQYGLGAVVKVRPALIATRDDLVELVDRLDQALSRVSPRPLVRAAAESSGHSAAAACLPRVPR